MTQIHQPITAKLEVRCSICNEMLITHTYRLDMFSLLANRIVQSYKEENNWALGEIVYNDHECKVELETTTISYE